MAKTPKRKSAPKKPARPTGRPALGERVQVAARYPKIVLDGLRRRAEREGITINDAYIKAALDFGDFPEGRPKVTPERRGVASKVKTSEPDPIKPGARLDKKTIGARVGPKVDKSAIAKGAAPAVAEEEAV